MYKIFSLTFLCLIHIGIGALNTFDNSEKELGDVCNLNNNQRGSCEEITRCEHVKDLFRSKRTSEIVRCRFLGRMPLICCPKSDKTPKFEQALCKDKISSVKFQMNIVNTRKANIGEFPYNVVIGYENGDKKMEFKCSGSLIADDIVLTAADCVNINGIAPTIVRLGRTSLDLNDLDDDIPAQDIDIEKFKIHPEYSNKTKQNNIAMIKLKKPAIFSEFVETICLSSNDDNLPQRFKIIGFGRYSLNKTDKSTWLLKATSHLEPSDKCKKLIGSVKKEAFDSQYCALSDFDVHFGFGDPGDPMSYEENNLTFLYGITSYRRTNDSSNPIVYTKINRFLDWIEAAMTEME